VGGGVGGGGGGGVHIPVVQSVACIPATMNVLFPQTRKVELLSLFTQGLPLHEGFNPLNCWKIPKGLTWLKSK